MVLGKGLVEIVLKGSVSTAGFSTRYTEISSLWVRTRPHILVAVLERVYPGVSHECLEELQ